MNPNSTSSSSKHIEMVLSSHTRAVSDINWSIFKPEMIATCSLDSYIHLWDLKTSNKKPVNSFCAWTGNQVIKNILYNIIKKFKNLIFI